MELKEAFLDFFHFSLPLKERIRNSEMPVVFVDFEGKVFTEHDKVIRYSWEAENESWVKAYLIPNQRTIYLCNNKFEKYVKRGLLVTINIAYYQYKINSNLIPYLTQNEFNDINSFSKALIESIEKSLNQEKSKEEFFMGKMKERAIELADLACKLTTICAVSNKDKKLVHIATKNGERFGWISHVNNPDSKACYISFVADINWETETITYYASEPYYAEVLFATNKVFGMCDEPKKYRILSIDTRTHEYELFKSDYHDLWERWMFMYMGEHYIHMHGDETPKANESKTNEDFCMELKEAFLNCFNYDIHVKERIRSSERQIISSVNLGGRIFKEADGVIKYSWEIDTGVWVGAYLVPNKHMIYICHDKFKKCVEHGLLITIDTKYYRYKINPDAKPYLSESEFDGANSYAEFMTNLIKKILSRKKSKTNEEEKTMSTTNETNRMNRVRVTSQVETVSHEVTDSLIVEEIDMLHMIDHVIINAPATIVFWKDGTKTVVKCKDDDQFDPEKGVALAFTKKVLGNNYSYINKFNTILKKAKVVEDESKAKITFINNECRDEIECEDIREDDPCLCDDTDKPISIIGLIKNLMLEIQLLRTDVDSLMTKKKKKSKKDEV